MKSENTPLIGCAEDLEIAGLVWQPEIGDEVSSRTAKEQLSILVDPMGMSPGELRSTYLWIPTVEQLVHQFEARQAILEHVGLDLSPKKIGYRTVVRCKDVNIEVIHPTMRLALATALRDLLLAANAAIIN